MKTKPTQAVHKHNAMRILLVTALILLVPFVAMRFSSQVTWSVLDFVSAGVLLLCAGFTYEFLTKNVRTVQSRLIIGGAVLLALLFIWAQLSVGIFS